MRSVLVRGLFVLVVVATLGGCSGTPSRTAAVDRAAIGTAIDGIVTAMISGCAARDTSAIVALYADDAQLMPPNAPPSIGLLMWLSLAHGPSRPILSAPMNATPWRRMVYPPWQFRERAADNTLRTASLIPNVGFRLVAPLTIAPSSISDAISLSTSILATTGRWSKVQAISPS